MESHWAVHLLTIAAILATGVGAALLGSVKLALAARLNLDEDRVGTLVSAFGFVMIPMVLVGGLLTDLGKGPVLVGGALLMAGSVLLLGYARSYAAAFAAVVVLSASWAGLVSVVNPMMLIAWPKPRFSESTATNLGNVFFGIGCFLTPLAVTALVRRCGLSRGLAVLTGVLVIPALLALPVPSAVLNPPPDLKVGATRWDTVVLWLCALTFFFYGPLEASMGAWTTTYLKGRGVPEAQGSFFLSAFWLSLMFTRLVTALSLEPGNEARLIFLLALLATAVMAAIVFSRNRGLAVTLVVTAGLVFGPIFPTLMAIVLSSATKDLHGRATGMVFAIAAIGWTAIPALIGVLARRTTIQRAFIVAVGAAGALCVATLLLTLAYERAGH